MRLLLAITALFLWGAAAPISAQLTTAPPSIAQSPKMRDVDITVPSHVPLKIKLKAEKEASFKDRTNTEWLRDFQLEVTNTSSKPIYLLILWLVLPDTITDDNHP